MREKRKNIKLLLIILAIVLVVLIAIGVSVKASGSSGIAKSVTFTDNMDGYYVYFRAVDSAGNVGEWSNAQRIWIDTTTPTVTAKENSVTIKEGDINALEDYFTVVANGTNADVDVVCTIGGVEYTTTEALTVEGSPYTVVCTASKNGGNSGNDSMELVVESALPEVDFSTLSLSTKLYELDVSGVPGGTIAEVTITYEKDEDTADYAEDKYVEIDNTASMEPSSKTEISLAYGTINVLIKFRTSRNQYYDYTFEWSGYIMHCFVADTPVLTTEGLKNIQDIKMGDYVYAMDIEKMQYEICRVSITFASEVEYDTYLLYLEEECIESTDGHQYYAKDKGWLKAKYLETGDVLINYKGEEVEILNIERKKNEEKIMVYNFEVENHHNYFVGTNMVLTHNPSSNCFVAGTKISTPKRL